MSNIDDFFASAGASNIGIFPFFESKVNNARSPGHPFGFLDDGDYFIMPTSPTTALSYRDNANVSQWSKANSTTINAASDAWLSFTYDSVDDLLYVTSFDETTDVIYLASINAAGTIVNIGTSAATTVNLTAVTYGWGSSSANYPSMIRDAEGSGNFTLYMNGGIIIVLNSGTGAIVSETVNPTSDTGNFVSTSGVYFTPFGFDLDDPYRVCYIGKQHPDITNYIGRSTVLMPTAYLGLPQGTSSSKRQGHLSWGGDILLSVGNENSGPIRFDKTLYNDAVDEIATAMNII